jgi:hypothetical protein
MTLNAQPDDALPLTDFINSLPKPAPWGNRPLPKIIWMFWHSGLEGAPDVVHRSLTTWQHFNPDHEVRFLTLADAEAVLGVDLEALFEKLTVDMGWANKADVIRMMLLAKFGGIWADATTFCLKPLSEWLHDEIRTNGFFCFRQMNQNNDREMVNWFLASISGHPLLVRTLFQSQRFLFKKRNENIKIMLHKKFLKKMSIFPGERFGIEILKICETRFKKTSYFWMFYVFKTVLDNYPRERNFLRRMTNRHAPNVCSLKIFLDAYVSKQTYKPIAVESYKKRVAFLFDGSAPRTDFPKNLCS